MTHKEKQAEVKRRGALDAHVKASTGALNPETLARSYGLPIEEVRRIIAKNGGR